MKRDYEKPMTTKHFRALQIIQCLAFGLILLASGWTVWGIVFLTFSGLTFLCDLLLSIIRSLEDDK